MDEYVIEATGSRGEWLDWKFGWLLCSPQCLMKERVWNGVREKAGGRKENDCLGSGFY
jgi:hypothetical protein